MELRSLRKKIHMTLLIGTLVSLSLVPAYAAPKKDLYLEVLPTNITFQVTHPETVGEYPASEIITVRSFHSHRSNKLQAWRIYINAEMAYLAGSVGQKISISQLEWSTDGITYRKLSATQSLVAVHQGMNDVVFEDRIYYRLLADPAITAGTYAATINFEIEWN